MTRPLPSFVRYRSLPTLMQLRCIRSPYWRSRACQYGSEGRGEQGNKPGESKEVSSDGSFLFSAGGFSSTAVMRMERDRTASSSTAQPLREVEIGGGGQEDGLRFATVRVGGS